MNNKLDKRIEEILNKRKKRALIFSFISLVLVISFIYIVDVSLWIGIIVLTMGFFCLYLGMMNLRCPYCNKMGKVLVFSQACPHCKSKLN